MEELVETRGDGSVFQRQRRLGAAGGGVYEELPRCIGHRTGDGTVEGGAGGRGLRVGCPYFVHPRAV